MVSETEHVWSVWIGFLFQTFRDWLESIRLTKNSSRWIWDRNNFCVWIQAWTPNEDMYTKSKKSKMFGPNLADKCASAKTKNLGLGYNLSLSCIYPPRDWSKSKASYSWKYTFQRKIYFGQRLVDTTVLAVVTIVVSIRSFCCRSGREQLLWSGSKARR